MGKLYVCKENLNEYERKHGKVSYQRMVECLIGNSIVQCDNINDLDNSVWDNLPLEAYGEDEERVVYQYFLCNVSEFGKEKNAELGYPLIISHSDMLDLDVLLVDHCGTSWDYVLTNIEWTENVDDAT